MDIFFPKRDTCVGVLPGEVLPGLYVASLSGEGSLTTERYLAYPGIPIRVHRPDGAEEPWLLDGRWGLFRVRVSPFAMLVPEESIRFQDGSEIVSDRDGLRIRWKGRRARGQVPLSDLRMGGLRGVLAVEGEEGLRFVLTLHGRGADTFLSICEPDRRPDLLFPGSMRLSGIEIASAEDIVLASVVDGNKAVLLDLSDGWVILWDTEVSPPDRLCAAYPILAEASELRKDGIGMVLAREGEDRRMQLTFRVTDAERSIQERVIQTDVPMLWGEPVWRVTLDRRYVVAGTTGHLFAIRIH